MEGNTATQKAYLWLRDGASLEDTAPRWVNHFHDPLREWGSAGLGGPVLSPLISSSPLWAQDSEGQDTFNEKADLVISEFAGLLGQSSLFTSYLLYDYAANGDARDWSWPSVREYFYTALTSGDEESRQEYFARTFRGVGHQMHLLEDMAVPEHVRNDPHVLYPILNLKDLPPTPLETLRAAHDTARDAGLEYVYIGNIRSEAENTYCHSCRTLLIEREGYLVRMNRLASSDRCPACGTRIPGVWA